MASQAARFSGAPQTEWQEEQGGTGPSEQIFVENGEHQ